MIAYREENAELVPNDIGIYEILLNNVREYVGRAVGIFLPQFNHTKCK